jgi:hypothetical protein
MHIYEYIIHTLPLYQTVTEVLKVCSGKKALTGLSAVLFCPQPSWTLPSSLPRLLASMVEQDRAWRAPRLDPSTLTLAFRGASTATGVAGRPVPTGSPLPTPPTTVVVRSEEQSVLLYHSNTPERT